MSLTDRVTFSAGGGYLDRATHLRPRAAEVLANGAEVLPIWQDRLLIAFGEAGPRLGWIAPGALPTVEVGDDGAAGDPPVLLGEADGKARFAIDVSALSEDAARTVFGADTKFIDLRSIASELPAGEATVAATAKGVLGWHSTHPHCARCGARTQMQDAGWRRGCPACGALHFPRTDPVVIMLIVNGDRVLLGRQARFLPGMYSLLAGFMEPGETVEDAVRRETFEEAGIRVGPVSFVACQPWPFPANLMLGCAGVALDDEITRDPNELEDALWLDRSDMAAVFEGTHPTIRAPRTDAIACTILRAWVDGQIALPGMPS